MADRGITDRFESDSRDEATFQIQLGSSLFDVGCITIDALSFVLQRCIWRIYLNNIRADTVCVVYSVVCTSTKLTSMW